mgnify:CR=1 FL=1
MMRKQPKYCQGFVDRHGRERWYFRRPGFDRVALPGLPWSPTFMAAYEAACNGGFKAEGAGAAKTPPRHHRRTGSQLLPIFRISESKADHAADLSQHN